MNQIENIYNVQLNGHVLSWEYNPSASKNCLQRLNTAMECHGFNDSPRSHVMTIDLPNPNESTEDSNAFRNTLQTDRETASTSNSQINSPKIKQPIIRERVIKTSRMTMCQQDKAKRFHNLVPVRTIHQVLRICGKDVILRLCDHLGVSKGDDANQRSFPGLMKNIENKFRRLPEYKLRFNKSFEEKR